VLYAPWLSGPQGGSVLPCEGRDAKLGLTDVAADRTASHEVRCFPKCCMHRGWWTIGFPTPTLLAVSDGECGLRRDTVPRSTNRSGSSFHKLRASSESSRFAPALRLAAKSAFREVAVPLRGISEQRLMRRLPSPTLTVHSVSHALDVFAVRLV